MNTAKIFANERLYIYESVVWADMSFNYITSFPENEKAREMLSREAEVFSQADFSMLNLENIFGDKEKEMPIAKSVPNLISDISYAEYVHALSPDIVGFANNHAKDYGEQPMLATIKIMNK